MKIYVINLRAATDRRANIERQFASLDLDYRFFDAIDAGRGVRAL